MHSTDWQLVLSKYQLCAAQTESQVLSKYLYHAQLRLHSQYYLNFDYAQ